MKSLLFALSLAALASSNAQVKTAQGVELLEFGTFRKLASHDDLPAPGAIAGARHAVSKVVLLESTTNIAARVGTSFGFLVKFPGKPSDGVFRCTAKCRHPRLTDRASGRGSEVEEWDASGVAGEEGYIGYTLDSEWELVPGPWTIQVFVDSKLAIEKTFNLYSSVKH